MLTKWGSTRRRTVVTVLLGAGALLATTGPAAAAGPDAASRDVYVSPSGSDRASGTAGHPVRTLERARDLVRQRAPHLTRDLTVHLAPGVFRLTAPLRLDARDSGGNGHRVIWQGSGDTELNGGVRVTGWRPVADTPGAVELRDRRREALRRFCVEREQVLTGGNRFSRPAVDVQTGAGLHALTGEGAARTESPHRQTNRHRVDISHRATVWRGDCLGTGTAR